MTQDPHGTSWDAPDGEQPVEPSAGPTQPPSSDQPSVHDRGTGGWAQPTPPAAPSPPQGYGPPAGYGPPPQQPYGPPPQQPYAPQQYAPQQYAPQQYAPQQYAPQQYAPQQHPQPGYGQEHGQGYGGSHVPVRPQAPVPAGAVVLLVVSGLLALVLSWSLVGLLYAAPAVLGVVALTRRDDSAGARRLTRTGWIVFAVVTVLLCLLVVVGVAALVSWGGGVPSGSSGGGVSV